MLSRIPGWLRTRRYVRVYDMPTPISPAETQTLLALHEFKHTNGLSGPESTVSHPPIHTCPYCIFTLINLPTMYDSVTDALHYTPSKTTVVALYKRLVIGVTLMSSPQETYITYLAVRAGWESAGVATCVVFPRLSSPSCRFSASHLTPKNAPLP